MGMPNLPRPLGGLLVALPILLISALGEILVRSNLAGHDPQTVEVYDIFFQAGMVGAFIVFALLDRREGREERRRMGSDTTKMFESMRKDRRAAMDDGMNMIDAVNRNLDLMNYNMAKLNVAVAILVDRNKTRRKVHANHKRGEHRRGSPSESKRNSKRKLANRDAKSK